VVAIEQHQLVWRDFVVALGTFGGQVEALRVKFPVAPHLGNRTLNLSVEIDAPVVKSTKFYGFENRRFPASFTISGMPRRFPNLLSEMEQAGFHFTGHAVCSRCHKKIEYWSPPGSAPLAYDLMANGASPVKPHRCGRSSRELTPESARRHAARW
jgi:hypothetical protein